MRCRDAPRDNALVCERPAMSWAKSSASPTCQQERLDHTRFDLGMYRRPDPLESLRKRRRSGVSRRGEGLGPRCNLVTHTSLVFSATHRSFVVTILGLATARSVDVVADQTGCPTYAPDLASDAMWALKCGVSGLLHVNNTGATCWFEFAFAPRELKPDWRTTESDRPPPTSFRPRHSDPDTQSCVPNARPALDSTRFLSGLRRFTMR